MSTPRGIFTRRRLRCSTRPCPWHAWQGFRRMRPSPPQVGQAVGKRQGRLFLGRLASTGPNTSGMTSPALRTKTVSPGRTSLASTWSSLCSVASDTVEPPTKTGSSMAKGVAFPVRPIDTMMSLSTVVRSSGGNL